MRSVKVVRFTVLTLIGALTAVGVQTAVQAAQASPSFVLSISPTSQTVQRGQTASYTVTATSQNGFNGTTNPITISASGGPAGTTLSTTTLQPTVSSPASATLTVATTSSTAAQSYTITVSGTSGKIRQSATTALTVTYPASGSIALSMTPSSLSVPAGTSAVFTVELTRTGFTGTVTLGLYGKLPTGVTSATFDPATLSGTASASSLTVTVDPNASPGTGTIYIVGSGAGGSPTAYTQGSVTISKSQGKTFTISGAALGTLAPGVTRPVPLAISNPNHVAISVTNLTVSITGTNSSSCSVSDFTVAQYTGPYPISIPAGQTVTLSPAVPDSALPQITMINRASNQDGCKNISLSLAYSGAATGS